MLRGVTCWLSDNCGRTYFQHDETTVGIGRIAPDVKYCGAPTGLCTLSFLHRLFVCARFPYFIQHLGLCGGVSFALPNTGLTFR